MTDFFVLAGGFGKRAAPLSSVLPKPMFPLNGVPLLELLTRQLISSGLNKGFINTHHLSEKITGYPLKGAEVTYIHEKELTGNRVLAEAGQRTKNNLLVLNGDTFLDIPVRELIGALDNTSAEGILLVRQKDGPYSSIITGGGHFLRRDRNPEASELMYTGVSIFRNEFLSMLTEENLFDSLERSGGRIGIMDYTGLWLDIGTPETYFHSDREYRRMRQLPEGNSLSTGALIENTARVENSILWKGAEISGRATVTGSIVTEGVKIRNGIFRNRIITHSGTSDLVQ